MSNYITFSLKILFCRKKSIFHLWNVLEFYLEVEFSYCGVVCLDCLVTLNLWMLVTDTCARQVLLN